GGDGERSSLLPLPHKQGPRPDRPPWARPVWMETSGSATSHARELSGDPLRGRQGSPPDRLRSASWEEAVRNRVRSWRPSGLINADMTRGDFFAVHHQGEQIRPRRVEDELAHAKPHVHDAQRVGKMQALPLRITL